MADNIIIFSGKQYSGKDTAAKILMSVLPEYKRCAMGDIIKIEYAKKYELINELEYCHLNMIMLRTKALQIHVR